MSSYTLFFNPMSRAMIAKWAFAEAGVEPELVMVEWENKPQSLLDANPMGKLPTVIHHHGEHDHVITEAAAICHYLAEMEAPDLLPRSEEKADYFRWLLFAAGPMESAVMNHAMGWDPAGERQEGMAGFGSYSRVMDTMDAMLSSRDYVCGDRFTMADVYVGSQFDWGLNFGTVEPRDSFRAYQARLQAREAYRQGMGPAED
ncbi:glutathione S-transferase family protein [Erythrobacter sp. EC-HK427]|uniref:glutathione S-transferase family protein n=1 Tax=Erythrobacter sp. EC-HK427 TaxID=2038396 RepID=UPI00125C4274|nr:glutathione S-transferase family protein [Erythrobacter sp. EC-HK427]VVT19929.1 Glutathione S-transferase [Erythrobacter sp. EC-HK427]